MTGNFEGLTYLTTDDLIRRIQTPVRQLMLSSKRCVPPLSAALLIMSTFATHARGQDGQSPQSPPNQQPTPQPTKPGDATKSA
ncbi:MAG TPA: hypothetical protein VHZ95_04715, partial [Polyangiales bacterium]|nr:hypothetical protein [Polyangiales bacterium]